jgi:hypothetical protein
MIRMTREQLAEFKPLDEQRALDIQATCQCALDDTITLLYGFVLAAEMPAETKETILSGLGHLSAHIKGEMKELTAEVGGRLS